MQDISTASAPPQPHNVAATHHSVPDSGSAVSWAAIFAGAAASAALSLILLILGTGFGFSVISPWAMEGIDAATFGFALFLWLSFTQFAASGLGGYLAGRLRTKWPAVHTGEVFFRDTAHGFLTWAVANLLTAAVLASVIGAIVGGGVQAGATAVGGAGAGAATALAPDGADTDGEGSTVQYYVDSLFRADGAGGREEGEIPASEVARIFARALRTGELPQDDVRHIAQLISERTDISQREAEQRVNQGFERLQTTLDEAETTAREVADEARKATAYAALWLFVTLLIGAFSASLMAVFGGRQRDA